MKEIETKLSKVDKFISNYQEHQRWVDLLEYDAKYLWKKVTSNNPIETIVEE